jgi:GNAT superfamily N-acetyltransferase
MGKPNDPNRDAQSPKRNWLARPGGISSDNPQIAPLTAANMGDLRLPWLSRFNADTLAAHLNANPDKALWVPRTGEYVLAERWRRRDDIANVVEVTARKGKEALVRRLVQMLGEQGNTLVLLAEDVWHDQSKLYAELGFGPVEKIVFFQRNLPIPGDASHTTLPPLEFRLAGIDDLDVLLGMDSDSFPWLWWNSPDEMGNYMLMNGVYVYTAWAGADPIGYASFTMYNGWAHLDRLAVVHAHQGKAYGAAQLIQVLGVMSTLGATSVSLSTQENNLQSHRLYTRYGFRQTRESMYLYGRRIEGKG